MLGSILKPYKSLILVSLLGAFLVFFRIGRQSLWLDEGLTLNIARNWNHMWYILSHSEPYMWTYVVVLHYWMKLGYSESYLRGLSALFAIGTIPFMYALGRKLFNPSVGIMAALLISINAFFVRYAQEIRAYSLLVLASTILSYVYVLMLENPTKARRVLYIAIGALSIYTHQFAVFIILSHLISLFFTKNYRALGFIFPLLAGIGLLCSPLLLIRVPLLSETSWIDVPKPSEIYDFMVALAGGNQLLLLVQSLMIASGFVYFLKKRRKSHVLQNWHYIFTVSLLLIPVALVILVSYTYRPIFVPRYLIVSVVPFILLASYGLVSMGRMSKFFVLLVILAGSAAALSGWYGYYPTENRANPILQPKDDWRDATNYVLSQATGADTVLFYPYYTRVPFEYYLDRYSKSNTTLPLPSVPELASGPYTVDGPMPEPNASLIQAIAGRNSQVWLVLSHNKSVRLGRIQQTEQIERMLETYYRNGGSISFTNIEVMKYIPLH